MCKENYLDNNRLTPCEETGLCCHTKDKPLKLDTENQFAFETYNEIEALSVPDFMGFPTLSNIDFYFKYWDFELTREEFDDLMVKLIFINNQRRFLMSEYQRAKHGH